MKRICVLICPSTIFSTHYSMIAGLWLPVIMRWPANIEWWVLKTDALMSKKRECEEILHLELNEIDDNFQTLAFLAQELQIRTRGIWLNKVA